MPKPERLIFCCTPGRSGTNLLAKLLELVPDVYSVHEGKPSFHDYWWKTKTGDYAKANEVYKRFWRLKLKAINSIDKPIYSETSHMVFKGFIEYLPEDIDYSIIFLYRDPRDIAKSLYAVGDIPGRTTTGMRSCFDPESNDNILNISGKWSRYTGYQLCYWYVLESLKRMRLYFDNYQCKKAWISLLGLLDLFAFRNLLLSLDLSTNVSVKKYQETISVKWNIKEGRKRSRPRPEIDYDKEEGAVNLLLL